MAVNCWKNLIIRRTAVVASAGRCAAAVYKSTELVQPCLDSEQTNETLASGWKVELILEVASASVS